MRPRLLAVLLGLMVVVAACSSGPEPGDLTFELTTPNSDDGAIQFRLTSTLPNTLTGVSAGCAGCTVFSEATSETEILGVVTGQIRAGRLVRVSVSDVQTPEAYTASVVAVASRDFGLTSAAQYRLSLAVE